MHLWSRGALLLSCLLAACSTPSPEERPAPVEGAAPAVAAPPSEAELQRIQSTVTALAEELSELCPISAPGDEAAFDQCRQALFGDSMLRRELHDIVLWGRARPQSIKETPLTQFAPDVLAGLYIPLFMFEGTAQVQFDADEQLYKATLPVQFRNRLQPGQFPYPFWHEPAKWTAYQGASRMRFFIEPESEKIRVAQYESEALGEDAVGQAEARAAAFDGQWLWTDEQGRTQPQVTLFDGLYSAENPHLEQIESAYRSLALEMRDAECNSCHKPDNPNHMDRLVLLQTPAHAAGEIDRILRSVREGSMPQDDFGIEKPLPAAEKDVLLDKATAFQTVLDKADSWEGERASGQP